MITSQLMGGLGNQMFQVAAAVSLAKDFGEEVAFDYNQHYLPNQGNAAVNYVENIFRNIVFKEDIIVSDTFKQRGFHFRYPINNISRIRFFLSKYSNNYFNYNLMLKGYFQSYKYFFNNENYIKKLFSIDKKSNELINDNYNVLLEKNPGFIHIRRGDYLDKPNIHPTCTLDYYYSAINMFDDDKKFLVFSDDLDWCKKNFQNDKFVLINDNLDYIDLYLMSMCSSAIISNSSFSWWGAYLIKESNKKIIAPKNWFGDTVKANTKDLIPKDWILL